MILASNVALKSGDRSRDVELVRALVGGDREDALAALYDRLAPTMMAVLLRMLPTRADAEELLQEVFVELWRRAPQYDRGRGSVRTWAVTIARSRALDLLRARKRRRAGDHDSSEGKALEAPASARPDRATEALERARTVSAALTALSVEQREALELSYFGGLSHSEIAEELGIPLGTVKSRIIKGMKVLRQALRGGDA